MPAILLLLVVPAVWAVLFRWTRCPGFAVVGGVAAGLLLGPTILGRVAPDVHRAVFTGGVEQYAELRRVVSLNGAEQLAAREARFDELQLAELSREQASRLEDTRVRWQEAQWAHQRSQRGLVAVLVAVMLAGSAAFAVPRGPGKPSLIGALSVGAWSAALPGGLAWLALRGLWDTPATESALVAAAVAIGPWALTAVDRNAADEAEAGGARTVQSAGRVATLLAVGVGVAALWSRHGPAGLLWSAAPAAVVVGWALGAPTAPGRLARWLRGVLQIAVVPAVAAAVAVRIDLFDDFAFWPALVIVLLSGDGRWLGAFAGTQMLGGRRGLRTMRLIMGSMAAGPTQLALTAVGVCTWSIEPSLAMSLLLGAVFIEVTAPLRRGMAARLGEIEESH